MIWQNLSRFNLPAGFRGRSAVTVQLWWLAQATIFKWSPQFAYGFRAALLRLFGAHVGIKTVIRPSVRITYPWKVRIGDYAWIGDNAELYSLGEIEIGAHAVVSQNTYLCAGTHDYTDQAFPILGRSVVIGAQAWVASNVYVAPGVTVGEGAVIGARSAVFQDMPSGMVCMGSPCRAVKRREMRDVVS